jgi:chitinase
MQDKEQKIPLSPTEFVIKLGRYNLSLLYERDGVDAYAIDIFINPNWKYFTREYDSDIAVIKLSTPVTFSNVISPICLWKSNDPMPVDSGKIVGYGKSERDTLYENIPRELDMKILTNEECFLKGPRFSYISSVNTFCAGKDEYSAACQGDSGNGFFVQVNDRWYLRGIISASFLDRNNTCDTSADTLFTNVLKFSKWIQEKAPTSIQQFVEEPTNDDSIVQGKEIVCSFTSWAVYRKKGGRFTADTFDPKMCTTVIYHFSALDDNYKIKASDPWLDLPDNNGFNGYRKFTGLKKSHPHLRLLLSIGGWNEGVQKYSRLASNETLRKEFATQSAEYLKKFGFDGLNFYWDFPGDTGRGGTEADKENLSLLLEVIHKVYSENNLYLSATLRTRDWIVRSAYDLEEVAKHVDAINMITFDYSSSWDQKIGYPAALKTSFQDDDIDTAINSFIDQKVPKNKMIMGIFFQAQTFKTYTDGYIGDECEQEGFPGPIIQSSVLVGFNEICRMQNQKQWTYEFDKVASQMIGRFKENGTTHVAVFDTPRSVANKVKYAMEKGLLGVWAWSIDTDDFRGECTIDSTTYADFGGSSPKLSNEREFSLLRTMNDVMKFMDSNRN